MFRNCNRQMNMGYGFNNQNECCREQNVIEPTITKCIEKEFYHEIPHVCPIHTHVINKHIYRHTYTPQYTCSEECQTVNLDCGKCSGYAN